MGGWVMRLRKAAEFVWPLFCDGATFEMTLGAVRRAVCALIGALHGIMV